MTCDEEHGLERKIEKDAVVKRHAMKNVGMRGKTKILKDVVMKGHVTKHVGLRGKIEKDDVMKRLANEN